MFITVPLFAAAIASVAGTTTASGSAIASDLTMAPLTALTLAATDSAGAVETQALTLATTTLAYTPTLEDPPAEPKPDPVDFWHGWAKTIEGGLNGSSGNSENLNLRFGFATVRTSSTMVTKFDINYAFSTDNGNKTKSRGESNLRNDWSFGKDSPWGFFALGKAEFDEFQRWNWRLSAFAGPSYTFIKDDRFLLRGRVGAGLYKELGGDYENAIIPEALFGVDFNWKITKSTQFFSSLDYLPSLKKFTDYRLLGKAGVEILVDPELNLSLKMGVEDRYDSKSRDPIKKNDVDYFITLAVKF